MLTIEDIILIFLRSEEIASIKDSYTGIFLKEILKR